jgi:hypothetical protein
MCTASLRSAWPAQSLAGVYPRRDAPPTLWVVRVREDDEQLRPWHYMYVYSIESSLIMRIRYDSHTRIRLLRPESVGCLPPQGRPPHPLRIQPRVKLPRSSYTGLHPVVLHGVVFPDTPTHTNCRRSRVTGARLVRISENSWELIFLFLGSFGGEMRIEEEGRLMRDW